MNELSAKPEARDMKFAPTLSRCEAARTLGRFRCDSGKTQSHCVGLGLLPSLRSKRPRCPLLRASSYGSVSITLILSAARPVSSLTISMILVTSLWLSPFSVEDTTTLALLSLMKHTQSP